MYFYNRLQLLFWSTFSFKQQYLHITEPAWQYKYNLKSINHAGGSLIIFLHCVTCMHNLTAKYGVQLPYPFTYCNCTPLKREYFSIFQSVLQTKYAYLPDKSVTWTNVSLKLAKMCATPKTTSPSRTCGPSDTWTCSCWTFPFLGAIMGLRGNERKQNIQCNKINIVRRSNRRQKSAWAPLWLDSNIHFHPVLSHVLGINN